MGKNEKPSWWVCYLIHGGLIGLIGLDYAVPLSHGWHQALACATVACCYGLIAWWLHANRAALAREDRDKQQLPFTDDRDAPLSPVQARYLRVMQRYRQR